MADSNLFPAFKELFIYILSNHPLKSRVMDIEAFKPNNMDAWILNITYHIPEISRDLVGSSVFSGLEIRMQNSINQFDALIHAKLEQRQMIIDDLIYQHNLSALLFNYDCPCHSSIPYPQGIHDQTRTIRP